MTGSAVVGLQQDSTDEPVAPPRSNRPLWLVASLASLAGIGFTTVQILEKITILKDPTQHLSCDVGGVLSCTNVLNAWQSSVLGPPNALIGAIMFSLLGSGALAGVLGTRLSRPYLVTLWGLDLFFLCFASWFMFETAFSIRNLCVWCTGIVTAVLVIAACLTRIADREQSFGTGRPGSAIHLAVRSGADLMIWAGWWLVLAALLWLGLS